MTELTPDAEAYIRRPIEYALQVVPVGQLQPQQIIAGLRAPEGFDPVAVQIVPVVLQLQPSIGELHAPRSISGICLVWGRDLPPVSAKTTAAGAR